MNARLRGEKWKMVCLLLLGSAVGVWSIHPRFHNYNFQLSPDTPRGASTERWKKGTPWAQNIAVADAVGNFRGSDGRAGRVKNLRVKIPPSELPEVKGSLHLSGYSDVTLISTTVYDTRTGRILGKQEGPKGQPSDSLLPVDVPINWWLPTPVTIAIDFAYGKPVDAVKLISATGSQFAISPPLQEATFTVSEKQSPEMKSETHLRWRRRLLNQEVVAVTVEGRHLDGTFLKRWRWGITKVFPASLSEISQFKISYTQREHFQRVLVRLPELIGMPEANRNVRNMFDMVIGDCAFQNATEFERAMAATLGLKHVSETPHMPSWPEDGISFKGGTVREMLQRYENVFPGMQVSFLSGDTLHFENPRVFDVYWDLPRRIDAE